mgnify:CR=1 FL=1
MGIRFYLALNRRRRKQRFHERLWLGDAWLSVYRRLAAMGYGHGTRLKMRSFDIDFLETYDNDSVLSELKRIASSCGQDTVTKSDIERVGRVSYSLVVKRFGSLRQALQLAGLVPQRFMNATDEELLEILVDLWEQVLEKEGRTPQRKDLKAYNVPVSGDTYIRRFGTWKKALVKAANSVDAENAAPSDAPPTITQDVILRKRENLSVRKRFFVMKRDSFACVLCGASGHGTGLEIDHKVPFSHGGDDTVENLQTLCFDCNRGKRASYEGEGSEGDRKSPLS